jgi:hypothetical protein
MSPDRIARIARCLPAVVLLFSAAVASAQAPPAAEWKVFQEFNFVTGSWSGPAQSGGRVGGRVVSFALEVDGATLGYRATTYFPVKDRFGGAERGRQDRLRRRREDVALVVSTKAWGIYDAEVRPDGSSDSRHERWRISRRAQVR